MLEKVSTFYSFKSKVPGSLSPLMHVQEKIYKISIWKHCLCTDKLYFD
uniref:Uncharacterized protein n=1 Tax=Setaria italica TaxID=4555 RepID=K3YF64_SETIT